MIDDEDPFAEGPPIMEVGKFYRSDDENRYFCFAYDKPLFGCVTIGYDGVTSFHADGWCADTACFQIRLEEPNDPPPVIGPLLNV